MSDEDGFNVPLAPRHENADGRSDLRLQEKGEFHEKIADLLKQVDEETEQFRKRIAGLVGRVTTLNETEAANTGNARDDLILRLRDANQSLVLAALGAQEMQATAEAVNHRQKEFLSMLAHELRNPLAPVAMAAELLGTLTDAHPQLPKLHGIIQRQVGHMSQLVDDLVDASRVSSGKIMLQKRALPMSEIIESAVETSQPFIDMRRQHLRIELPEDLIVIDGDLVRLAQVFSNLLINATKFTPEDGRIAVSAHKLADTVVISVKDSGMGIGAELLPVVFDLFTQGPRALDRSQGGLGIGLSLVRTLVELHGGTVSAHSEGDGLGSEFTVCIPISSKTLPPVGMPGRKTVPHGACRILLIEDNADANETLADFLTLEGHVVASALDGPGGLALANEYRYDLIICDIGLPGMDGYEVARRLRRQSLNPFPCLLAVTGYEQADNRLSATEAGFDHYLVKPVAIESLRNLIASHVSQ